MQKGNRMKYLAIIFILVLLSGCSSLVEVIAETAFEKATDTEISYVGASCPEVRRNCSSGNYQQWYQSNGKLACACNN
tara:strand:- start:520 stop:753 length:234 start_codon:yes stop_codon:yes gene_type:complete